jgi:hypothetical protein
MVEVTNVTKIEGLATTGLQPKFVVSNKEYYFQLRGTGSFEL